jgi:MFS family permease
VLINRNFAKLWTGQAISVVGDEVFRTTLLLWTGIILLAGKSYAPAVSSIVLIITSVVVVVLGPVAGVFADRWDKKRTMLRMDLIRAVLIGALAVVSLFAGSIALPVLLAVIGIVVAGATAAAQFFGPARIVMIRDIVPDEAQGRASGLAQSAGGLAGIVGPPLAAPLLVGVSVSVAIAVNAVSFLLSFVLIRAIRVPAEAKAAEPAPVRTASVSAELRDGLRYARDNLLVRAVTGTTFVINLGIGAFAALDVYFVSENLGANPEWFGLLGGAFGVGAISGSLVAGWLTDRLGAVRVVTVGLLTTGALFTVYSRMSNVYVAMVVIAFTGLALGALDTAIFPAIIKSVPRDFLGRVAAVINPANRLGMIVSIVISSVLASTVLLGLNITVAGVHLGRIDSIFLVAGVLMALSGVYFGLAARKFPGSAQDAGEVVVAK